MTPSTITARDVFRAIDASGYYDLYPGYDAPKDPDAEYYFDSKTQAYGFAQRLIDEFRSLPKQIPIYRALRVPSDDPAYIDSDWGESWSYVRDMALLFGEQIRANFLLSGYTSRGNIDWDQTLLRYFEFTGRSEIGEYELVVINPDKVVDVEVTRINRK